MQGAPTSYDELEKLLADDFKIKVAGIDVDGILRGKVMQKDKFLSIAKSRSRAFGFCRYAGHAAPIALFQPYRIEIWLISKWFAPLVANLQRCLRMVSFSYAQRSK